MAGILLLALTALAWGCSAPQKKPLPPVQTAIPATPTAAQMPQHEWILVDLPANATQLEYGAEVYRLVCQDCHGDRGQGLTAEWRATWAPQDRNCWQSKCHAANHPQDGFTLPAVPPVVGPAVMARFATAQDLHDLIQAEMPWYRPGNLTDKDSWSVTAHILQMNQINFHGDLNAVTAAQIHLH